MSNSFRKNGSLGALLLASAVTLGGCGTGGFRAAFYVPGPPPLSLREVIVASPGLGYVWIPGYHQWDGARYVWVGGRWDHAPRPHARWQSGRWRHSRQGWYFVDGRWR